jgi:hypothetical protein
MLISLYSPKGSYDANFLINYCGINLRDQLLRIPGSPRWTSSAAPTTGCGSGCGPTSWPSSASRRPTS